MSFKKWLPYIGSIQSFKLLHQKVMWMKSESDGSTQTAPSSHQGLPHHKKTKAATVNDNSLSQGGHLHCCLSSKFFHCPVCPSARIQRAAFIDGPPVMAHASIGHKL
jgi:hypothetical protein